MAALSKTSGWEKSEECVHRLSPLWSGHHGRNVLPSDIAPSYRVAVGSNLVRMKRLTALCTKVFGSRTKWPEPIEVIANNKTSTFTIVETRMT